jgi:hypothetical protein
LTRPFFLSLFSEIAEKQSTDVNGAMLWTIAKLVGHAQWRGSPESVGA